MEAEEALQDVFKDDRTKSECLLLPSHLETMREVFERLDKYNDGILKRQQFLMALRIDELVVDFIDADAVKVACTKPKILTMDQVMCEIEKDEFYEQHADTKNDDGINHKEFITYSEFVSYFTDYREIEDRNKSKQFTAGKSKKKKPTDEEIDPEAREKSFLIQLKEDRLKLLPKIRPADIIDISEEHLLAIKAIFDKEKVQDVVTAMTFFF